MSDTLHISTRCRRDSMVSTPDRIDMVRAHLNTRQACSAVPGVPIADNADAVRICADTFILCAGGVPAPCDWCYVEREGEPLPDFVPVDECCAMFAPFGGAW